jgi:esterase/lipase superfamily enzyme
MQTRDWTWTTPRLTGAARLKRWGHFGTPFLLFPTAGGDLEELERFGLLAALAPTIEAGRIKVYSVDGLSIRSWLLGRLSLEGSVRFHGGYDEFLREEVVQRIREDCLSTSIEIVLAGASLGALTAVGALCLHPDVFRGALGLSGVYTLASLTRLELAPELDFASPVSFLRTRSEENSSPLPALRRRRVLLGTGEGALERPAESRRLAAVLEARGVPHTLELWGAGRDHDFRTWREMLPKYAERLI